MAMIADALLVTAALGAALYCYVLARRLRRFTDLEKGVGGAVAVMSMQVDDLTKALAEAKESARSSTEELTAISARAEGTRARLELLVAALHDVPEPPQPQPQAARQDSAMFVRRPTAKERA